MTEQRIDDEELGKLLDCGWAANGTGGKMYLTELSVVRCIALDLRDARAALRLREQGGAYDHDAAINEAKRLYGNPEAQWSTHRRIGFEDGAHWQSQQPAPAPSPDAAPTYRERLRDEFALAFIGARAYVCDLYPFAGEAMREREKNQTPDPPGLR